MRPTGICNPYLTMSACSTCKAYNDVLRIHTSIDDCEFKHVLCRRCHQRGHMTHMCTEKWSHWERPTSMEELIPFHIRQRYSITSSTSLTFEHPRGPDTLHELHPINEIIIPEDYKNIVKLAEKYNIIPKKTTKASSESYIQALKEWADMHGCRVVMQKATAKKDKNTIIT